MTGLEGIHRKVGPTILTVTGSYFDFADPEGSPFGILDIAHALSHLCRFTGHVRRFYSVAEHSVHCSHLVPAEDALAALLHDAPEAFLGDVSRPLKSLLPGYRELEARIEPVVLARFGLPPVLPPSVKVADRDMLLLEQRQAMGNFDNWPELGDEVPDVVLGFWEPEVAMARFLARYRELAVERYE